MSESGSWWNPLNWVDKGIDEAVDVGRDIYRMNTGGKKNKSKLGVFTSGGVRVPGPGIIGQVSQAPGGWDPNSRFPAETDDSGDQPAADGNSAMLQALAAMFKQSSGSSGPSAASIAAAAKAKQDQAALDQYAGDIIGQINTGSYKEPYTAMSGTLAKYLGEAQKGIGSAYDTADIAAKAAQAANPYADVKASEEVVAPALTSLLMSQGVDPAVAQANVASNTGAASARQAAFNDFIKGMAANYGAGAAGRVADVGVNRAQTLSDLLGQNTAYGTQIAAKEAETLQGLKDKLGTAASKGANVSGQQKLATEKASKKSDLAEAPKSPKDNQKYNVGKKHYVWKEAKKSWVKAK